ncbi:MAG: response regulator [Nitrososphaerota archaeon]|nr:response regulator [Candidatus Bathyarchaeota archaeon]MDW8048943.1 response regulator [Nitrososphaerota archaeon]
MADKILVVDDEADIANLAKIILESEGYSVVTASNGEEALAKVYQESPDLVLLDIVMPKKTGLEVCRILKEQKRTRQIPVIVFSVLGREVDRRMSAEVGADAHFVKPFTPESLVEIVRTHLLKAKMNKFSSHLGFNHSYLSGRKMLLEFSPDASYERCVRDFILEAKANGEAIVVLTAKGSAVYQVALDEGNVDIKNITAKPIISPILDSYRDVSLSIVFDNLSDMMLSLGLVQTYNFVRNALENMADQRITALFLLNPDAHQPSEAYSIRGLFRDQLAYRNEGLTIIKISPPLAAAKE